MNDLLIAFEYMLKLIKSGMECSKAQVQAARQFNVSAFRLQVVYDELTGSDCHEVNIY